MRMNHRESKPASYDSKAACQMRYMQKRKHWEHGIVSVTCVAECPNGSANDNAFQGQTKQMETLIYYLSASQLWVSR